MSRAKKNQNGTLYTGASWSTPTRLNGIDGMNGPKGDQGPGVIFRGE